MLAVGQPNGILRLVDPTSGNDWARLTHLDMSAAAVIAFSPDQRYLVTSGVDERSPTYVWDLSLMRSELALRGLDWPAEVLAVGTRAALEGQLEVVLDDGGLLRQSDSDVQRKAARRLMQNSANFLQRLMKVGAAAKTE